MPSYVALDSIQRPSGGATELTQWGDQVNDDVAYLYQREQFQVYLATAVSIPNAAQTTLALDTVNNDTASGWSAVTHQYTVQGTGNQLWLFTAYTQWAANGTGNRALIIEGTGSQALNCWHWISAAVDASGRDSIATLAIMPAGATVAMQVFQSSGGSLNTGSGFGTVQFNGVRVG